MSTTTVNALDELLRPYEARPLGISRDEVAERKRGTDVGAELDRIEGVEPNAAGDRLINLWCLGQVTQEEFNALVAEIARRGLYEPDDKETARDGR